jgi:hypothetical protein
VCAAAWRADEEEEVSCAAARRKHRESEIFSINVKFSLFFCTSHRQRMKVSFHTNTTHTHTFHPNCAVRQFFNPMQGTKVEREL